MTFQPNAPHKKRRWLALLAVVMLGTGIVGVGSAMAAPVFSFVEDQDLANDEPGQKDLTGHAAAQDSVAPNHFFTAWKWDETQFSGKNTGDGCSLFDTDVPQNELVDYALCATVGGGTGGSDVTLESFILYECSDGRTDRCTNPEALVTQTTNADDYCTVIDSAAGEFDAADTEIQCDISAIAALAAPPITVFGPGTLHNTCSYPSREPNSDPSDCVLTDFPDDTTTVTTPTSSVTWSATLNDSATVTPAAAGNVVFKLYLDDPATTGACNAAELVFTDATNATNASGVATTTTSVNVAGTYNWTADFTPTDPSAYNPSASACGSETVTVTAATAS